jgi:hypothetical protein
MEENERELGQISRDYIDKKFVLQKAYDPELR